MSKRRGLPGGVIARDEVEPVERRHEAAAEELAPRAGLASRTQLAGASDQQPGFLERLANRGEREGARPGRRRAARELREHLRAQIAGAGRASVRWIDAPARKHVEVRHEREPARATPEQNLGLAVIAAAEHERRSVARYDSSSGSAGSLASHRSSAAYRGGARRNARRGQTRVRPPLAFLAWPAPAGSSSLRGLPIHPDTRMKSRPPRSLDAHDRPALQGEGPLPP